MTLPDFIPVVTTLKIRKYVQRFFNAGATSPERTKTLVSQGLHGGPIFDKLLRSRVFFETSPGYYYVDLTNFRRFLLIRRSRIIAIVAGLLVISVVVSYLAVQGI